MDTYCYLFLLSVFIRWFTYYVSDIFRYLNDHLPGKKLFIRFTTRAFRKLLSIYIFSYFPFGFEGRIWDLIVSVPDHCLYFYFFQFHLIACTVTRHLNIFYHATQMIYLLNLNP